MEQENLRPNRAIGPGKTSRNIPERVARRVWIASGGRCVFCNRWLLDDETTGQAIFIGQLAHIVGWDTADGSPRGSSQHPVDERNEADNLMLICYDQHHVIDSKSLWDVYSVDRLQSLKRAHEYRIKQLTALAQTDSTTVLRVVGTIHGAPVQLAQSAIAESLIAAGRFPSYALLRTDEYEVDLRKIPGEEEGTDLYWLTAVSFIRDRLRLLKAFVADGTVVDLAVFPLARIPILISLGAILDDTVPTKVYPKRRDGAEAWGWPATGAEHEFEWRVLADGAINPDRATVVFSVSGSIEIDRLPEATRGTARIYELRPVNETPNFDLVDSPATVDAFARTWRSLLSEIETHEKITEVNLVPAVPITIAVAIGRQVNSSVHPPMRIYDRTGHDAGYAFTLELPR
ncbi:SAVED domain-containing protein [Herbiconiux sp. YIM B11900]|uniref:SAVED domain-containing protein n=1 Tax=Herbiconiux sp. YIM B11900 TaxID=3404131 RepID=UPI003F843C60